MRLTISMPVYDEEQAIEAVVEEALSVLDEIDGAGEVVVVDDGSTDRTPEILARIRERDPRLRVLRNENNLGIASFNRRMIEEAFGDWVFFIGSDGEWSCREALRFLELAERFEADGVLGYRAEKRYGPWRRFVSRAFNGLVWMLFGARFHDIGSIRLLRRSLFGGLRLYSESAFLNAERLLVGRRKGARYVEVPVEHRERLGGRGAGARPRRILESFRDLFLTRLRWSRFDRYYA